MKSVFTLFVLFSSFISLAQLTVDGSTTPAAVANHAPAIVVDSFLSVSSATNIDGFKISISNFSTGDELNFTGTLPAGVFYSTGAGVLHFIGSATPEAYQALLRTVTFKTTSSSTLTRTIKFEAGDGTLQYHNGHYYKLVTGSYTWATAKTNAATQSFYGLTSYLVTITSAAENAFVTNLAAGNAVWGGASDETTEGKWLWVTGPENGTNFSNGSTVVSGQYANWNTGEPNNSSNEDYLEINSTGRWNDLNGTATKAYVIEFGGLPAGVTVDNFHTRTITMIATQMQTTVPAVPYKLHGSPIMVDPDLTLYCVSPITEGKAVISSNFQPGDILSINGSQYGFYVTGYDHNTGVLSIRTEGSPTTNDWQQLFRSVQFSTSSSFVGDRIVTFSVGDKIAASNGHFYEYISASTDWGSAKTAAESRTYLGLRGYLATITSQTENDFIQQKLQKDAWIGLSDRNTFINAAVGFTKYSESGTANHAEGNWHWVTGPEKGTQITTGNSSSGVVPIVDGQYNNWNSGEPNNKSSGNNDEHYALMYASPGKEGKWNDEVGGRSFGYVVEYGGLSGDPLIFLSANRTISMDVVLPVTGLNFQVTQLDGIAQLKWTTETESNTDRFEIQHSTDGIHFISIGSVNAKGNSTGQQRYNWQHTTPDNGTNYYRLQQFDQDGRFTYSSIQRLITTVSVVNLWPNPASSVINIQHAYSGKAALHIYNQEGKKVYSTILRQHQTRINIEHWPAGLYIAEIDNGIAPQRIKFIKN